MEEMAQILEAWAGLRQAANPAAILATVIKVEGSAYRRPGARTLLMEDGRRIGVLSGGCVERQLSEAAWSLTRARPLEVSRYDSTSDADVLFGSGLGCRGVVHVLLERLESVQGVERMAFRQACRQSRRAGLLGTIVGASGHTGEKVGDHLMAFPGELKISTIPDPHLTQQILGDVTWSRPGFESQTAVYPLASGNVEVFLEVIAPPLSLLVFGAGPDTVPLVRMAKELGWHVRLFDTRPASLTRDRFPEADELVLIASEAALQGLPVEPGVAAVVMSHNFFQDLAVLDALLTRPLSYLGILGPRARTERLLSELPSAARETPPVLPPCLHAPVGLDIGAETPEEIALAILAEIQATLRKRSGGRLRDRAGSIHDQAAGSRVPLAWPEAVQA